MTRISTCRAAVPTALFILAGAVLIHAGCAPTVREKLGLSKAQVHLKRGSGYYFNHRYTEALTEYSAAIAADGRFAEAYRSRSYAFAALGDDAAAEADLDRAIGIEPGFSEAYLSRGELRYRKGSYAEAIDDFDRVIELDPWNATARYYKALACEKIGLMREAVEAYKGYIHCAVPRQEGSLEEARRKIRELESSPRP